jgi:hypothetical protein
MADGTLKVGTITTSSGSGTITIPSGVSLSGDSIFKNDEFFLAYQGSDQSLSNNTWTKLAMNTMEISNSNYDTSSYKYTVPTGKAGTWMIGMSGNWLSAGDFDNCIIAIRKNGTSTVSCNIRQEYYENQFCTKIVSLSVGDYLEPYGLQQSGGSLSFRAPGSTASNGFIYGYRIGA